MRTRVRQWVRVGCIVAASGLSLGASSCTLIVDSSSEQCETNADCSAFPGTTCSAEKVCVSGGIPCATSAECGELSFCHRTNKVCVSAVSAQCNTIEGNYKDDSAFIFGSVSPTQGADQTAGLAIENAMKLAIREFQQTANGLPPVPGGMARRPLVLIGCNDNGEADGAVVAAQHLASIGVPAVVGAAFSGITIRMVTEVTIPNNMLAISPSATSSAITDIADNGLVWRTSPSDIYQADALALYFPQLEQVVRTELMLQPADTVKVAIVHKGDSYGSELGKALEQKLVMAGVDITDMTSYLRSDYGDPDNAAQNPPDYGATIAKVQQLAPHIIFAFGTNESVDEILKPVEAMWPEPSYRPRWVLSDGGLVNGLWQYTANNSMLRRRISGTIPGTSNLLFGTFRAEFNTQFNDGTDPDVFGAAGAYDATYLLAYSVVSLGNSDATGPALAQGLTKMIPPGTPVDVGTTAINSTFTKLAAGETIDFNGASGPLDFDPTTGEAPSDIQIWCLRTDDTGSEFSGLYYNASVGQLQGMKNTPQCDP